MKFLFSAGVLLLGSALAQTQPVQWTFRYTGFYDQEAGAFQPGMALSGAFAGDDADGDGLLERAELQSLTVDGTDHVPVPRPATPIPAAVPTASCIRRRTGCRSASAPGAAIRKAGSAAVT